MKALIVDDERYARLELKELLASFPEVQVVGEACNAGEARQQIAELKPDLIFLDIQMPEETGIELLASLKAPVPNVIFTTAYDSFALQAFEFGATDYLLKPVAPKRLALALRRIEAPPQAVDDEPPLPDLSLPPLSASDKVLVNASGQMRYIPVHAIIGAESLGAYSILWIEDAQPTIRRSLLALEARLPSELFFRANRSQLINLRHVQSVSPWFSGGLKLTMSSGKCVEVSRRQARIFRQKSSL